MERGKGRKLITIRFERANANKGAGGDGLSKGSLNSSSSNLNSFIQSNHFSLIFSGLGREYLQSARSRGRA